MRQAKASWPFQHPLEYIQGKTCKRCGKPATCAVVNLSVMPACDECGKLGKSLGYDVVFQEKEEIPREYIKAVDKYQDRAQAWIKKMGRLMAKDLRERMLR